MTLSVQVDWARNGSWTDVGDDVSARVRPITGAVTASYGRSQSTALTPITAGQGTVILDNSSRDYSPRNTSSPLYGRLKPARPARIRRTAGANTYTLFVAHTDSTPINPDVAAKRVTLQLVDSLADLRNITISTQLYGGIRTGAAIGKVLDAIGWTGGRDLDLGSSILPWWWEEGTDALQAMQNLIAAEGPPALLTIGDSGEIIFRDRSHRLVRTRSTTSQATLRGSGAEPTVLAGSFDYNEAWQNVINTAVESVPLRRQQIPQVVWSSTDVIDLATGQTVTVKATTSDPYTGAITPVFGTDITVTAGSATVIASLDRTSGAGATISLIAPGPSRITSLQLRAQPVTLMRTLGYTASDPSSVSDYGARAHPDIPFAGYGDTNAIVQGTLAQRAQPLPIVTCSFQVGGSRTADIAKAQTILGLDLSDRVTVIEPETNLSTDFFVESIAHELTGDDNHVVTLGLEACPTQVTNVLILGSATRGILGTNRLGKQGLDDPSTVFVLGTSLVGTGLLGH